jgi:hypothetical protein
VLSGLFIALALFAFSLLMYMGLQGGEKYKPGPQLGMYGGDDLFGDGQTGEGGVPDPTVLGQNAPTREEIREILPDLENLDSLKVDLNKALQLEDPNSLIPLTDAKAASYSALDKSVRDKMLGIGQKKGDGKDGQGGEGGPGAGTGTGSDSTRARTLRWIIAFKTLGGRDYLDQLQGFGAKVIVPMADGKTMMLFRSLAGSPPQGKIMTESDWNELSGLVQFNDYTALSRSQVGEALGMGNLPKGFWAFFPKEVEKELARKEVAHQQRRSEDIEETKFEVVNRNGKYEMVVTRQTLKK